MTASDLGRTRSEGIVEDISDVLNDAYAASNVEKIVEKPELRYKLLTFLLTELGELNLGTSIEHIKLELKEYVAEDALKKVEACAEEIGKLLYKIGFHPTYTAVSYWSPIDRQRRTVAHRRNLRPSEEERYMLAYAYAFYALTRVGSNYNYFSVIQFTSERAVRKRGVPVCYKKGGDEDLSGWWHIHEDLHKLILDQTGIADAIRTTFLENHKRSNEELKDLLGLVLSQEIERPWKDVDSFAQNFIDQFHNQEEFPRDVMAAGKDAQAYLSCFFRNPEITVKQAIFMMMTHLIYKEACPTDYIQTYTVRVGGTCCAITVGSEEPFDELKNIAFGHLANAIFMPPLLLDYSAQEVSARLQAERNAAWRKTAFLVAHKFGNTIFPIENYLHSLELRLNQNRVDEALEKVYRIRASLKKGKEIVYRFKRLKTLQMINRVATPLRSLVVEACEAAHDHGVECDIRCPSDISVLGDSVSLSECFGELVKNSIRWCNGDHPRIQINVTRQPTSNILIHFKDNGPGVTEKLKEKIFEEFYTTCKDGSGMGLADVKHIIEAHDGKISEHGEFGCGVDFVISLPETLRSMGNEAEDPSK